MKTPTKRYKKYGIVGLLFQTLNFYYFSFSTILKKYSMRPVKDRAPYRAAAC